MVGWLARPVRERREGVITDCPLTTSGQSTNSPHITHKRERDIIELIKRERERERERESNSQYSWRGREIDTTHSGKETGCPTDRQAVRVVLGH